ncbi:CDF family Co(II)/Ni(II) efflux transporter DmeF [Pararhizobium sp. LjRoot235]|uniref:CDF family Co(II)/Ni(II) efflux transporter DmeF n=1 Tax=Pararhizobium sp. LjRoot235 TaxID=3342291 RepID=UPI003ECE77DD
MATHAGALAIAAWACAFAKRHARDRRFSFGTGKVGDLAGFASALILAVIALGIAVESVGRLLDPRPVDFFEATVVAVVGLLVNIVSALLLKRRTHVRPSKCRSRSSPWPRSRSRMPYHHDNNMRAAFVHVIADALTSVLAIAALLSGRYLGWVWLDPVIGIAGVVVIATWSWSLIRQTAVVLLDATDVHLEAEVRGHVEGKGDAHITDLHIWRVSPGAHAAIVSFTDPADGETVRSRLASLHQTGPPDGRNAVVRGTGCQTTIGNRPRARLNVLFVSFSHDDDETTVFMRGRA